MRIRREGFFSCAGAVGPAIYNGFSGIVLLLSSRQQCDTLPGLLPVDNAVRNRIVR